MHVCFCHLYYMCVTCVLCICYTLYTHFVSADLIYRCTWILHMLCIHLIGTHVYTQPICVIPASKVLKCSLPP